MNAGNISPFYIHTYTNTHVNHQDDTSKCWPVNIPWDIDTWENDQTIKNSKTAISGNVIRELRQHAKAIEANFNFTSTDPTYSAVDDAETASGDTVDADEYRNPGGDGLIDGVEAIGIVPGEISENQKIDKDILNSIAQGLEAKSAYANYTNRVDTGYNKYTNYAKHSNHSNYGESYYYRKFVHTNYSYKNKYSNHGNHSNVYGNYQNQTVNQPEPLTYSDSFNNPAIYQNTL